MNSILEVDFFQPHELHAWHQARSIVSKLPNDIDGEPLRCHEVARVVGKLLNLEVLDGRYEYGHDHSWCVITAPNRRGFTILDTYAIARLPPVQLVAVLSVLPTRYFPEALRKDIKHDVVSRLLALLGNQYG